MIQIRFSSNHKTLNELEHFSDRELKQCGTDPRCFDPPGNLSPESWQNVKPYLCSWCLLKHHELHRLQDDVCSSSHVFLLFTASGPLQSRQNPADGRRNGSSPGRPDACKGTCTADSLSLLCRTTDDTSHTNTTNTCKFKIQLLV